MQKNLTAAACEEKVVALTLDDKRREQQESATAKAQKRWMTSPSSAGCGTN